MLRPVEVGDAEIRFDILSNPEECAIIGADCQTDPEHMKNVVLAYRKMDEINFARHWTVVFRETLRPIGFCDVFLTSPHLRRFNVCEISFGLLKGSRGQGLMREAVQLCLQHMMGSEGFFRIEASVNPKNYRSINLLESVGFRFEGVQRQKWVWNSQRHDMLAYALLASERKFEIKNTSPPRL